MCRLSQKLLFPIRSRSGRRHFQPLFRSMRPFSTHPQDYFEEGAKRGAGRRPRQPHSSLLAEWQKDRVPTIPRAGTLFLPRMSSMKRAILSRQQPFLAQPRTLLARQL